MKLLIKILTMATVLCLMITPTFSGAVAAPFPNVARTYVLYVNGQLHWAHKPSLRMPPASLIKVMTAWIVLDRLDLKEIVAISNNAVSQSGSNIGLREGERWQAVELLAAMLIRSANDACVALAERNGVRVLLVLLNAPDRWWKAEAMLDLAFMEANR